MISFSGETTEGPFWKQILDGRKTQTCRKPRKQPIMRGDLLFLYWKVRVPKSKKPIHKIANAICTRVRIMAYFEFAWDNEFARKDGFEDSKELQSWFGDPYEFHNCLYEVIEFELRM